MLNAFYMYESLKFLNGHYCQRYTLDRIALNLTLLIRDMPQYEISYDCEMVLPLAKSQSHNDLRGCQLSKSNTCIIITGILEESDKFNKKTVWNAEAV